MSESAREIMLDFVARTGVERSGRPQTRYLWTDAFAVCNLLGLFLEHDDKRALELALQLVDATHAVLGRHRPDANERGWISGLDEAEGACHPTRGGLRIGKRLPERKPGEAFDSTLEWDRDGQYFHYLTKWMHALGRVSDATGDAHYREWAIELAQTAWARFCMRDAHGRPVGLYWKMSIDLSRPLVPSMGQHDPLDGFLVFSRLQAASGNSASNDLAREIASLSRMCAGRDWYTDDVLGIGGLLTDACSLAQMVAGSIVDDPELLANLLACSRRGLEAIVRRRVFDESPHVRLPFRELGLAIGLHAVDRLGARIERDPGPLARVPGLRDGLDSLSPFRGFASRVERFWLDPVHRRSRNWVDHLDINEVMLATSLAPAGYLET